MKVNDVIIEFRNFYKIKINKFQKEFYIFIILKGMILKEL
jgi:hypothetical protein